jgi:hypothetical protein
MKRLLFLSAFLVVVGAAVANAEVVNVSEVVNPDYVSGTLKEVDVYITGYTADANSIAVPNGDVINAMLGTWTAIGGKFNLPGTSLAAWTAHLGNDADLQDTAAPQTWLNFSTKTSDTATRSGGNGSGGVQSASFYVGMYPTAAGDDGVPGFCLGATDLTPGDSGLGLQGDAFDNTLLGKFYVTKSTTDIQFGGVFGFEAPLGGQGTGALNCATSSVPSPEPSSIALLGCGLFGLLAYAWRKRK